MIYKSSLPAAAISRGESLLRFWAHQCPQRHQGSDGNVHFIDQVFLCEWQRFHNGSRLVLGLRVDQEDDAFAVAARIPLAAFPVEVELHSCPNLCRYDGHDLLRVYALLGSLNDQHFGGLGIAMPGTPWAPPDCDMLLNIKNNFLSDMLGTPW